MVGQYSALVKRGSKEGYGIQSIWIEESYDEGVSIEASQFIILNIISQYNLGSLEVYIYDEALSGIGAPLNYFNSKERQIIRKIQNTQELEDILNYLSSHILGVQESMMGRYTHVDEMSELTGLHVSNSILVVLNMDLESMNDRTLDKLHNVIKSGSKCGVYFVIHSRPIYEENRYLESLKGLCQIALYDDLISNSGIYSEVEQVAHRIEIHKPSPISITNICDFGSFWQHSSTEGLDIPLGYKGNQVVSIQLGNEVSQKHNALITGAVGQGKSNTISTVIHSVCQKYSPDEVELYLLDLKEGVSLQQYIKSTTNETFPHARLVTLNPDQEIVVQTLNFLQSEYERRQELFKSNSCTNYHQFRTNHPEYKLPRCLVIIDEFQLMFDGSQSLSEKIAQLLIKSVRLFRSTGIHFILASQSIGGNQALFGSAGETFFNQIPIRIAMKNSISESYATLSHNNPAAAYIKPFEAIVNSDYGVPQENHHVRIAFADESFLIPQRQIWIDHYQEQRALIYSGYSSKCWKESGIPKSKDIINLGVEPGILQSDYYFQRVNNVPFSILLVGGADAMDYSLALAAIRSNQVNKPCLFIGNNAAVKTSRLIADSSNTDLNIEFLTFDNITPDSRLDCWGMAFIYLPDESLEPTDMKTISYLQSNIDVIFISRSVRTVDSAFRFNLPKFDCKISLTDSREENSRIFSVIDRPEQFDPSKFALIQVEGKTELSKIQRWRFSSNEH